MSTDGGNTIGLWTNSTERLHIDGSGNVGIGIGSSSPGATLAVSGTEALNFGTDYTTAGSQSDVAISTNSAVRYNGASAATFYGIVAGSNGQILNLHNASSSTLTLSNQSSSETTAANRIITGTGSDIVMAANSSVTLQYDATATRWRVIGGSGSGGASNPAGTTGQIQFNSGSNTFAANANLYWDNTNLRLGIGTSAPTTALTVIGTATATSFAGNVPVVDLNSGTGASSSTFWRGDGTWAAVGVGTGSITGTVAVSQGGTGETSLTAHSVMLGEGSAAVGSAGPGVTGTVLIGNSGADPSFSASPSVAGITLSGVETITFGSDYTTTGSQADVAINANSAIRYNGNAVATFYGIVAGTAGQILYLHNASSSTLTLSNQSASEATVANRIITGTGGDLAILANSSATLQYDGTAQRWRVIGGSGGGIPAGTTGQVQFNSGSNTFAANSNLFWDNTNLRLGIGTSAAPLSKLDAYGGVAIGTAYAGITAAPTNGAIIQGNVGIGSASPAYALDVNGTVRNTGFEINTLGADYATTGAQADVNLGASSSVRYNGAGSATFYGIVAGANGQVLWLHNASAFTLTLSNQSASEGTAANKIITGTGADVAMLTNTSVTLQYDGTASRWRVTGASGGAAGSGATGYVARWTNTATLGTGTLFDNGTSVGISSTSPTVSLDLSQTTDAIALPVGTSGQRPACNATVNGALRYNSTIPAVEACVSGAWVAVGAGGGQLLGVYSSGTPVSNNSIVFTGAANSSPSLSGSTLTLPSNTSYIVVEIWGGGGGGEGDSNAAQASTGGNTCFGTNATACTSPIEQANGGVGAVQVGGAGGTASGGDINLAGGAGGLFAEASSCCGDRGAAGGDAPLGGGGGQGGSGTGGSAATAGGTFGGGGGGGGSGTGNINSGGGGGGGGYASKLVNNPSGTYYYTIGSGGSASGNGGAGGAGGIKISVYSTGSTQSFNLATQATGTLPIANGGTNTTTQTTNGVNYFNGTSITSGTSFVYSGGNVGVGTSSPQSAIQAYNGEVQVGSSGASCASGNVGALRYDGTNLRVCIGGLWTLVQTIGKQVVILTSGTTWTVPSNWNSSNNTIEVIGGGGGGARANAGVSSSAGSGGGGAYSKVSNISLTVGGTVTYQVGAGGAGATSNAGNGSNGTDTFFNRTSGSANTCADTSSVCAKAGTGGTQSVTGAGGAASSGLPSGASCTVAAASIRCSGGNGGTGVGRSGAGGAGGPKGAGGTGGSGNGSEFYTDVGGGGGGGGGGSNGSNSSTNGGNGNGGNNSGGTGSGAGATVGSSEQPGSNGSNGGGGGGSTGRNGSCSGLGTGGNGGAGTEWTATAGGTAGSGGGGGIANQCVSGTGGVGGNGGLYGGGGGGGAAAGTSGNGGNGAQGVIVITYAP